MKHSGRYVLLVALGVTLRVALLLGLPTATASAQQVKVSTADSALEARTTEVAKVLRCPVCQGLSIHDSPSELSQQMRALVREQLAAGKSQDEVRAYFVSKYGEWILLAPKPTGFNLVAYVAPALLFLGGLVTVALVVRRWTATGAAETASTGSPDAG